MAKVTIHSSAVESMRKSPMVRNLLSEKGNNARASTLGRMPVVTGRFKNPGVYVSIAEFGPDLSVRVGTNYERSSFVVLGTAKTPPHRIFNVGDFS